MNGDYNIKAFTGSAFGTDREVFFEAIFEIGYYIIYVEADWA